MKKKINKSTVATLILLVVIAISPVVVQSNYIYSVINFMLLYVIATSGLDLLFGYSGQISLGHAGFYAIGAYGSALMSLHWNLHPLITMLIAAIIATIVGVVLAYPASKLKYHFLSLCTIGFGEIIYQLIVNSPGDITSGFTGLYGIPAVTLFGFKLSKNISIFYMLLIFAIVFMFVKQRIVHSKVGRAFIAIRDNTAAANGMGIDVTRYRVMAFGISAFYTAFAGALYAHFIRFISPETFTQEALSVPLLTMVLFGGLGSLWGPVIGSVVVTLIKELLQATGTYQMIIYSGFIVIVLLFMPRGIMSFISGIAEKVKMKKEAKADVKN
ncbi:MAG: branched-chain amino acid ABC transporter permease [Oscillibacter sp.]|nr:branched-chain amino acid ABC transporter permease [Oscillibacter sp.]